MKRFLCGFRVRLLLLAACPLLLSSCKYYEPVLESNPSGYTENLLSLKDKTVILHGKKGLYLLAQPIIDTGQRSISGLLSTVPPKHATYLNDVNQKYRVKPAGSKVLHEVHLYAAVDTLAGIGTTVIIPLAAVDRIEVMRPDKVKNTLVVVGLAVLIISLGLAIFFPAPSI